MKPIKFYASTSIVGFLISCLLPYHYSNNLEEFCILLFCQTVSLLLIFMLLIGRINLNFVSALIEEPKSPVYKFDSGWGRIEEYVVGHSMDSVPWFVFLFPPMMLFSHKDMVLNKTVHLDDAEEKLIQSGNISLEHMFSIKLKEEELKEQLKQEETNKIKSLNKDYYSNFKK